MAGTSNGFAKHMFVGARVGVTEKNPLIYTPAHLKPDQKVISARLVIPILINEYGQDEPDGYRLIAWGGRADLFCKNLPKGKEMHFFATSRSYWANVFNNQGQQVMQPDGATPVQIRQLSFTIRDFVWGADSFASLQAEIAAGLRPADWNVPGSPGNIAWKQIIAQRAATFYMGGEIFGYAKVVGPKTPGCQILTGDQSRRAVEGAAPSVVVAPGPIAAAPLTTQIAAALPTAAAVVTAPPAAVNYQTGTPLPGVVSAPEVIVHGAPGAPVVTPAQNAV